MDRKAKANARQRNTAAANDPHNVSSDDEDVEAPSVPQPAQRASTRRHTPRVDLSKLDAASLRRYRKVYKLGEAPPGSSKEELMVPITRHFQNHLQVMDESETLMHFALALRKASLQSGIPAPLPGVKKPRAAAINGKAKLR